FSALLLAFGHGLHEQLDVPVGLIVGAVGGTPSGYWLSREAYEADEACKNVIAEASLKFDEKAVAERYRQSLAKWEKAAAKAKKDGKRAPRKPGPPAKPGTVSSGTLGGLYERFIRPVVGYVIRGVLWDQGESGTRIVGMDQYTLMGALIRGWRNEWGQGDFPFLYIQKPSGGGCAWDPSDPVTRNAEKFSALPGAAKDGVYRDLHIRIRNYPKTYMVTASDLGSGVHPTNKWGYGQRAVRVALGAAYGRKVAIYGPTYESHRVEGNKVRVRFVNVGKGLAARHDKKLQGFAIAGEDKVFHWAEARIDGGSVVLSSDKVSKPVAVRYAWSRKHAWANLFNQDGLPALTFRTDNW
ncbi:MAG: sialate O-acetylesterase, partial [Phycisphaerae bacterium]|nr:sialate O-acetylesterase [Phycisphaerae bacterium]